MRKRGLSILLCLVMLVGLMPTTAFADGNIISSANITITKPVGGETPDFNPVSSEPEKYYAEVDDWGWMYAQSVTPMGPESKFKALNRYVLRILFRPKHGYFFENDCVFTINGEKTGWLNYLLLKLQVIDEPIVWLQSEKYLMPIMILVALWGCMGVGFLSILSGLLNINLEIYEAGYIDGIKNRFQEIVYITIPSIKPQMLFGAIMAIVGTFNSTGTGVALTGTNPTPNYAGQLIVNHIDDYGFIRHEMGYAAAVSVVVLLGVFLLTKAVGKLFVSDD